MHHDGGGELKDLQPFEDRTQIKHLCTAWSTCQPQCKRITSLCVQGMDKKSKHESMMVKCRGFAWLQTGLAITIKKRYNIEVLEGMTSGE